jgi:predicted small lipoprotein YifL
MKTRLAAVFILAVAVGLSGCGREGTPLPDAVQVTCHENGTTSLDTHQVRTQADGVHVRLVNNTHEYARLGGLGGGSAPGASVFVSPVEPGYIEIDCTIGDDHRRARIGGHSLTVRDVAGHWIDPKHRCLPGQRGSIAVIDYAAPRDGKNQPMVEQDPLNVARKRSRLRPDDVVQIVGYPKADAPIVRFIRDGRITKTLRLTRIGGRLAVGSEQRCVD